MQQSEFKSLMDKMGEVFGHLTAEQLSVFYEHLNNYNYADMKRAADILIETHKYRRFPLIAEIKAALWNALKDRPEPTAEDVAEYQESRSGSGPRCEKCGDTGWELYEYFDPSYVKSARPGCIVTPGMRTCARHCSCALGQSMKYGNPEARKLKERLFHNKGDESFYEEGRR